MSKKTLCIGGKNDITVNVLKYVLENISDIELIVIPDRVDDGVDKWQRSVALFSKNNGIRTATLEEVYDIDGLVFISTEFDRIIKPEKFRNADLYNIHFSMLPKYKGMFTSVLPILQGMDHTGVTLHVIRPGIDTGEIIEQRKIMIEPDWNSLDLYRELIRTGSEVVISNLKKLLNKDIDPYPQPKIGSTYYGTGYIDFKSLVLDTKATADQIRLQVNAFAFRPYQLLKFNGEDLIGSYITDDVSSEKPGTVLYEDDISLKMATIDYDIILYKDVLNELIEAIRSHDNGKAKALCSYKKIINDKESHGWTPLTVAVYNNNLEMAKWLYDQGADINVLNNNGTTLLMYAKNAGLDTGDWSVFRWLMDNGLSAETRDYAGLKIKDYVSHEQLQKIPEDIVSVL